MTIVVVGAVNSLSVAGGLSASALAGATVGGGVGLAGRLVNTGGPASTVGRLVKNYHFSEFSIVGKINFAKFAVEKL